MTRVEATLVHLATEADVVTMGRDLERSLRQTTIALVAVILVGNAATIGAVAALLKL